MTAPSSPASCNTRTCSRRSRPTCSSSNGCSPFIAAWTRRSTPPRSPRRSARACARSSITSARPSTSRFIADCWPKRRRSGCRRCGRTCRPVACSPSSGSTATSCSASKAPTSRCATASRRAMFTAWWHPFSRYGVIHGDPHLGNYTVVLRRRRADRHQPARLWLHTHLSAEVRRRRGRPLSRAFARQRHDLVVHAYETWGFRRPHPRTHRYPQYLGALHLRPAAR